MQEFHDLTYQPQEIDASYKLTYNLCMRLVPWFLLILAIPAWADDFSNEIKDLKWVGFQQFKEVSRVFVRTNTPAQYHVKKMGADKIRLTIENTRVPLRNNQRILDTQYFDSPVAF